MPDDRISPSSDFGSTDASAEAAAEAGADAAAADRFAFVRDGFHFWAALLGLVWLAWHRLWLALAGWTVLIVTIGFGMMKLGVGGGTMLLVQILLALLLGFEAASLERWTLSRRNWRQLDVVVAEDEEAAERRFFDRWIAKQRALSNDRFVVDRGGPPPTRDIPGQPFSKPAPVPHNEIIGWYPGQQSSVFPQAPPGFLYPGDPGTTNRGLIPADRNNFAPRLGFSYDPTGTGKMVIRGGYAYTYDTSNAHMTAANRYGGPPVIEYWVRPKGVAPDVLFALLCGDVSAPVTFGVNRTGWAPTVQLTAYLRALPADGWLRVLCTTVQIGQDWSYRFSAGETRVSSRLASQKASTVPTSRQ